MFEATPRRMARAGGEPVGSRRFRTDARRALLGPHTAVARRTTRCSCLRVHGVRSQAISARSITAPAAATSSDECGSNRVSDPHRAAACRPHQQRVPRRGCRITQRLRSRSEAGEADASERPEAALVEIDESVKGVDTGAMRVAVAGAACCMSCAREQLGRPRQSSLHVSKDAVQMLPQDVHVLFRHLRGLGVVRQRQLAAQIVAQFVRLMNERCIVAQAKESDRREQRRGVPRRTP